MLLLFQRVDPLVFHFHFSLQFLHALLLKFTFLLQGCMLFKQLLELIINLTDMVCDLLQCLLFPDLRCYFFFIYSYDLLHKSIYFFVCQCFSFVQESKTYGHGFFPGPQFFTFKNIK